MEKEKTFEEKLTELEVIVKKLESGDIPLDDAISSFNNAMKLAKDCNETLTKASDTICKALNKDGMLEDFKVEE